MSEITGKTLIEWGFKPNKNFSKMIHEANVLKNHGDDDSTIIGSLQRFVPSFVTYSEEGIKIADYLFMTEGPSSEETNNTFAVRAQMNKLARLPSVKAGAIMPDACVAGVIPVGGVIATEGTIHPGFHSADICCSMAASYFKRNSNPKKFLDIAQKVTHFGPIKTGAPQRFGAEPSMLLLERMEQNRFLKDLVPVAISSFMTQGDGNHFLYVGHQESTGEMMLVTHHGSRNLGAILHKRGMQAAKKHTSVIAKGVDLQMAWLDAETQEGQDYWEALQLVRAWTKENHYRIHHKIGMEAGNNLIDFFWNEHNFVFQKSDGLYYHAKGATPSYDNFSVDDSGMTLIPMNMEEPILMTAHTNQEESLGFAPHGAGRNMSRTAFLKSGEPELPKGIDYRFFCGLPDPSEYPSAYKSARHVTKVIEDHNLAEVVDRIIPYGSIMAGDWESNAPWRNKAPKTDEENV